MISNYAGKQCFLLGIRLRCQLETALFIFGYCLVNSNVYFCSMLTMQFIIGDGNNMYDFTYVETVAHAHICVEQALASKGKTAQQAAGRYCLNGFSMYPR